MRPLHNFTTHTHTHARARALSLSRDSTAAWAVWVGKIKHSPSFPGLCTQCSRNHGSLPEVSQSLLSVILSVAPRKTPFEAILRIKRIPLGIRQIPLGAIIRVKRIPLGVKQILLGALIRIPLVALFARDSGGQLTPSCRYRASHLRERVCVCVCVFV